MVIFYWIPGVVVLLVIATLLMWWFRERPTSGDFIIAAGVLSVTIVVPILAFYVLMIYINWDLGVAE